MINIPYIIILLILSFSSSNADHISSLLFNGNCLACHKEKESISAPSVKEFKKVYKDAFSNKEDFVEYMARWVVTPTAEGSLNDQWIAKYELMPHLGFDYATMREVSAYIYDTNFSTRGGGHWTASP